MKKINSIIYGLLGAGAILYGAVALLDPAFLMSEAAQSFHLRHIFREQGASVIFVGLMAFWCIFNYERRTAVHYCLVVLALLLAVIHWFDHFSGNIGWISPLYNSVPFLVLSGMAILSRRSRRD